MATITASTTTTYNLFHLADLQVAREGTRLVIIAVEESLKQILGLQGALILAVLTG